MYSAIPAGVKMRIHIPYPLRRDPIIFGSPDVGLNRTAAIPKKSMENVLRIYPPKLQAEASLIVAARGEPAADKSTKRIFAAIFKIEREAVIRAALKRIEENCVLLIGRRDSRRTTARTIPYSAAFRTMTIFMTTMEIRPSSAETFCR
jgi:hypothetical protein